MDIHKKGRTRLASLIVGTTMSAVSLLGASLARASTTITRQNGTRTTEWTAIATSSGDDISVDEGSLTNTASTLDRTDAFDGALNVFIGPDTDTSSSQRTSATLDTDAAVVNNSPNGGSVSGGATATVGGQDIGVNFSLVFASTAARVDGTFVVTNNSGASFDGYVAVRTNFGSDGSTVVEATSSGDTTVATGDTWVVSSESSGQSSGDDPIIVSASTTPGVEIGPLTTMNAGNDNLVWRLPLSLAPGASTTVNASHCLYETIAGAIAAAQSGSCVDGASPTGPTGIPTMQNPALLALAVLTGLLGAGQLRRRSSARKS